MKGKKIIIAVSGSIAAYKAAPLTRLLIKAGAEVQVLMTEAAKGFITPLTLATLSKRPVHSEVASEEGWNNHVELGLWADAFVVAPATATTLSKMANGICDSIITATYLSARCPVFVAPAMDLDMWKHPATVANIQKLTQYGNHILPVGNGELASGLVGEGRMAEPEEIVTFLDAFFQQKQPLKGKKLLITAGPTYEAIDPVRFIGNRSSGKMGIAIAEAAARAGATVQLILGPTHLKTSQHGVQTTRVESAQDMFDATQQHFSESDIIVLSAAVADYKAKAIATQKIKKKSDDMVIELAKTTDIAATLGAQKQNHQLMVGFALETNDELAHAQGKLVRKNLDFIVLNSLQDSGAGFAHDTNKVTFVFRDGTIKPFDLKSKVEVANDIVAAIEGLVL
jgi:phosphopantothenoylcysteine decarboxylase / phosphopantothenate---cysteine ligase